MPQPHGGSHRIFERLKALGPLHQGTAGGRHLPVALLVILANAGEQVVVRLEGGAEVLGHDLPRQIVVGGAETARAHHEAGVLVGPIQLLQDSLARVPHRHRPSHSDAKFAQTPPKPRRVRIRRLPNEEFIADGEEMSFHSREENLE